jgi:arabinan endo-1,5-alpha-L-arabinosidase
MASVPLFIGGGFRHSLGSIAVTALVAVAGTLSGCGGGGGGGGGGSINPAGPDYGMLSTIDDSFQLTIKSASSGQLLTIASQSQLAGASLAQASATGKADELWHVLPMGNNQFNIENLLTHQVVGISNASTVAGSRAVQWADNGTADHLWSFYVLTDGNYLVKNVNSGLYLQVDTSGASAVIDQAARATTGSGCSCQEWAITPTSTAAYPLPMTVSGSGVGVHDPNMIQDTGGTFWLYGTHNTLASSTDMKTFTAVRAGDISPDFSWWAGENTTGGSGRTDIWAPSVMFANRTYYQYYAIPIYDTPSQAGTNQGAEAVIALATSASPSGPWTDAGKIIASCGHRSGCTTAFNAIDPAPFIDTQGNWWLTFGSWEDGIHLLQLDPVTGLRLTANSALSNIAYRANAGEEGSFIFPWTVNGTEYYFYFASINTCCNGISSTYRIVVGRSTDPAGPYLDRGGVDLMNGGGTILMGSHSHVYGPGGQSVLAVGTQPVLIYHYYDGNANGAPTLGLNDLLFDSAGWPYVN